jgi:hypothetical protein
MLHACMMIHACFHFPLLQLLYIFSQSHFNLFVVQRRPTGMMAYYKRRRPTTSIALATSFHVCMGHHVSPYIYMLYGCACNKLVM